MSPAVGVVSAVLLLGACGVPVVRPAPPEAGTVAAPADTASPTLVVSTVDSAAWRAVAVDTVATGLEVPWAIAFASDGRAFVTERTGRIRSIDAHGQLADTPWATIEAYALAESINPETGLMGLALDTAPDGSDVVYTAVVQHRGTQVGGDGFVGRIVRRVLYAVGPQRVSPFVTRVLRWERGSDGQVTSSILVDDIPTSHYHAGGGLLRLGDTLFLGTGDGTWPNYAARADAAPGKILRIGLRGADAGRLRIEASGFRNVQGIAQLPDGQLLAIEHGPTGMTQERGRAGNDELNVIRRGASYGWPEVSGADRATGVTMPAVLWPLAIAPSGLALLPAAPGDTAVTALVSALRSGVWVVDLVRSGDGWVARQVSLLSGLPSSGRIRAVAAAPDGTIWVTTSNRDGRGGPRAGDDRILRLRIERSQVMP